ncbi:MAG: O-methyltransferase [Acidobacteria bacterium]|nr:O-methyltransferase [Acidobacteriota bacterium]
MGAIVPSGIEEYLASLNHLNDPILDAIAHEGRAAGLPLIDAEVGAFLQVMARAVGARRILEIGTAIGYSGIWLARALPPDGLLLTLEIREDRAATATTNFERAGVAERAAVLTGDAARLLAKVAGPFDLVFQDGDKLQYLPLLDRLIALLRPGGVLITDNILWDGEVVTGFVDPPRRAPELTHAIRVYNERLASDTRVATSLVPLRDGLAVSVKR